MDVELNQVIKGKIRTSYLSWLDNESKKPSLHVESPTADEVIEWSQSAYNSLSVDQIKKSFQTTGISEDITFLKDNDILNGKLTSLIDEYLDSLLHYELLGDTSRPYADPIERTLISLVSSEELEIMEDQQI